jgi:hypothetical protein
LTVEVRTAPAAEVVLRLQIRNSAQRLLYRSTERGTTDGSGTWKAALRVAYRPVRPTSASLSVTVRLNGTVIRRDVEITLLP